jgi:hypothetical protein
MSNRRRLERERLEYYLTYLILAYRRLIFIAGLLLLVYAVMTMFINLDGGIVALIPAMYLLLLSNSYNTTVYTARLGAWLGTLWRGND